MTATGWGFSRGPRRLVGCIMTALVLNVLGAVEAYAEPEQPGGTVHGSVQQQVNMAAMECPGDMPNCTRNRQFRRNYRQGDYGKVRARADINYSNRFRRSMMRKTARKWNRNHRSNFDRTEAWRHFINHDTCFTPKTWPVKSGGCKAGDQSSPAFKRGVARVLFCGAAAFPIARAASPIWMFYGYCVCQVGFFVT